MDLTKLSENELTEAVRTESEHNHRMLGLKSIEPLQFHGPMKNEASMENCRRAKLILRKWGYYRQETT